jgi:hypothetical protein
MLRPVWVGLSFLLIVGSLLVGRAAPVTAQEATPTTELTASTDVRYVVPYTPDGLNPGLTAVTEEAGTCGYPSAAALDRPDAWDCIGAEGQIYDPCFENPFVLPDDLGEVACFDSPFSTDVVVLTLTAPLARQKEAPDADMPAAQAAGVALEPWDLPWALELGNGDRCTLLHGTLTEMAGQTVHYGCADGGSVLGETDRSQPVWRVNYLAAGEVASTLVAVTAAWS